MTSAEIVNTLEKDNSINNEDQSIDSDTDVINMTASMDDTDTIISQTEKNTIEEQSEAYEKLEVIQEKYDIANIEGYAGAYFDNDNKINILFTDTSSLPRSINTRSSKTSDSIIFKKADNSIVELENDKQIIVNNLLNELPNEVYINIRNNSITIEVENDDIVKVKKIIQDNNLKSNIEYKIVDNITPVAPNAKIKLKAGTYVQGYDTKHKGYYNATIGYRAYKTCEYSKRNKKGKIVKSKRRCNGYTTAAHLELKRGASVWKDSSRSKSIGTANKMSRQTDTRFITLNTKNAYSPKKLRNEKTYHYVFSQNKNNDILVEGMSVTKVYRSVYSNAKWVSGKLTTKSQTTYMSGYYLDKNKGGVKHSDGKYYYPFRDTMEAKIPCVGGDSGGPLVRLAQLKGYKSKKYHIIGTTMSSDDRGYAQFSKVSRSQSYLGIKAY